MINISLINLGCAKNIVDSEAILNLFSDKTKFFVTSDLNKADLIILNTCAFIHDAENEVHIKSALNEESEREIDALAEELCREYK